MMTECQMMTNQFSPNVLLNNFSTSVLQMLVYKKSCFAEASGIFTGQSVVHYNFVPLGEAARTNKENFSFIFKTNCTDKTMVLLVILSKNRQVHCRGCSSRTRNQEFVHFEEESIYNHTITNYM